MHLRVRSIHTLVPAESHGSGSWCVLEPSAEWWMRRPQRIAAEAPRALQGCKDFSQYIPHLEDARLRFAAHKLI